MSNHDHRGGFGSTTIPTIRLITSSGTLLQRDTDRYETDRKLHLGDNEWHETTLIDRRKLKIGR